jgi:Rrf2 family protein
MQISARVEYAVRAALELAAREPVAVSLDELARAQELPPGFLDAILRELRRGGLLRVRRGALNGYVLCGPAASIFVGDVMRAASGPLLEVRGVHPTQLSYAGAAQHLTEVWIALQASIRGILDEITLQDVLTGCVAS